MSDVESFAESFQGFMHTMMAAAPKRRSELADRIRATFGADPSGYPIVSYQAEGYEHPSLQRALENVMESAKQQGLPVEVFGVTSPSAYYSAPRIQEMLSAQGEVSIASATYDSFILPGGSAIGCFQLGLILIGGPNPVLLYVEGPSKRRHTSSVHIDVMAASREAAEAVLHDLRRKMHEFNVYRGHSLVVTSSFQGTSVRFHPLPTIERDELILDAETLHRIERQTISFASKSKELAAAGRHLKRGVLMYGPPGTGKTLSAMYLASRMAGRTVLLTAGLSLGSLASACDFARRLQPATVILEDVDLVAEDREHSGECSMPLLFEMLNQMDGLNEDADVLFILTTNRPEALEPALAARPGRIDQAIEIPLPDGACRQRLIELYARGVTLKVDTLAPWVERTKGASAAFIRELLRRATLLALLDTGQPVVTDRDLDESMRELTLARTLTGRFLGFSPTGD